MKKLLLLCALSALSAGHVSATLLLYDGFAYTSGQLLAPTDGSAGQYNSVAGTNWYYAGANAPNTDPPGIATAGLNFTDVGAPGYSGLPATTGNSVQYDSTQLGSARIQLLPAAASSGTYYYSGLFKLTSLASLNNGNGQFLVSFNSAIGAGALPTTGTAVMRIRTDPGDSSKLNVGIAKTTGTQTGNIQFYSTPFDVNDTIFVVAAYEFVAGTQNDFASMWINPGVGDLGAALPPTPDLVSSPAGVNDINLWSINLRNVNSAGGPTFQFDELRVGTTWADVTTIPEPASIGLLALGLLACFRRMQWPRR